MAETNAALRSARAGRAPVPSGRERLRLLYVSHEPPSPPRYGAQARMHGLMTALARRHDLSAITLVDPAVDSAPVARAMGEYCREVTLVRRGPAQGPAKRLQQVRSLVSLGTYERRLYSVPALQAALDRVLGAGEFDVVNLESPFLAHYRLPERGGFPRLIVDEHNVEFDVLRQVASGEGRLARRLYHAANWRKLRREELAAWRRCDGLTVTSARDAERVRAEWPAARLAVVPNAVDVERLRPQPDDPPREPRTLLFFGALGYYPNVDAILFFHREVWPRLARSHPGLRLEIVGARAPAEVQALDGSGVRVAGFADDLRPVLARAGVVVAPLRLGGGTRLKILEAMAMGKAVVSTSLGAEGLEVTSGEDLLLADDPAGFAAAIGRLLDEPGLAERLGQAAREKVGRLYSWDASAQRLEAFFREVLEW
ncbi:MAG: glycosyltransferase family 4 protein [Myxococcales bacterium]